MTPDELLAAARQIADTPDRHLGTRRSTIAALLLRQALEGALDAFWARNAPGLERCSARAQLISLPFYLDQPHLAGEATYCWNLLSAACHHDSYELPPSNAELVRLHELVERLVARLVR